MIQVQAKIQIDYAKVGEPISHELAAKMVKDYNDSNPKDQVCFNIGKNIVEQILAQPRCAGLRIYNAINELGQHTLVYAGIDETGKVILEYSSVHEDGKLGKVEGLIGDRELLDIVGSHKIRFLL
jgi:hypothetical protein